MAIGAQWQDGSWVDASWQAGAWYVVPASTVEAAIAFAMNVDEAMSKNAVFGAGITFAQALSDQPQDNAIFQAVALYASQLSASYTGAVLGSSDAELQLSITLGAISSANATLGAAALFATNLSLDITGGRVISDAVTFALTSGYNTATSLSVEGSLLLNLVTDSSQSNTALMNAALALDAQLATAAISQGVLNAGLSLSCIQSVTLNGTTLAGSLITPDGRILTVNVNLRTNTINESDRTLTTPARSGIIVIED